MQPRRPGRRQPKHARRPPKHASRLLGVGHSRPPTSKPRSADTPAVATNYQKNQFTVSKIPRGVTNSPVTSSAPYVPAEPAGEKLRLLSIAVLTYGRVCRPPPQAPQPPGRKRWGRLRARLAQVVDALRAQTTGSGRSGIGGEAEERGDSRDQLQPDESIRGERTGGCEHGYGQNT